jgi:YVTN family beta-propeller protein
LLETALGLWRGPALADARDTPELAAAAARLEDVRLDALEERIDADLALGHQREHVAELEALVEAEPLRERARAQLMLALYRSGRQADALAAYQQGRRLLSVDLGLAPGPELRRLEQQILDHDPALAGPAAELAGPAAELAGPAAERARPRPRPAKRAWLIAAAVAICAIATGGIVLATAGGKDAPSSTPVPPNSLVAIDPVTNRVTHVTPIGRGGDAIAVTRRAVCVINFKDKTLSRLDLRAHRLATIGGLPQVDDVEADPTGGVWVSGFENPIAAHVSDKTLAVDTRVRVRSHAEGLATGGGFLWVTNPAPTDQPAQADTVSAIDLGTRRVARTVEVGYGPIFDAFGYGAAWTANHDEASVSAITPGSHKAASIEIPGADLLGIAAGAGGIWVVDYDHRRVLRIDPITHRVVAKIPVGGEPLRVATGSGSVWVTNRDDSTVSRIDSQTNTVVATVKLGRPVAGAGGAAGAAPFGIAVGAGKVWVSTQACRQTPCL